MFDGLLLLFPASPLVIGLVPSYRLRPKRNMNSLIIKTSNTDIQQDSHSQMYCDGIGKGDTSLNQDFYFLPILRMRYKGSFNIMAVTDI